MTVVINFGKYINNIGKIIETHHRFYPLAFTIEVDGKEIVLFENEFKYKEK